MIKKLPGQLLLLPDPQPILPLTYPPAPGQGQAKPRPDNEAPEKAGQAIRLPVPDFSDPNRKKTCLEVDFPIARINALSNLEGNAGKPIYQMSKWWARRRSSVFRSLLIAAATEAPDNQAEAAKRVWEHYYCNHQKAGSFRKLKVLDCFMGGGTTLVEGSRLGFQVTGIDLNPVAWFVVKNEMAGSDPERVKALFADLEKEVKPQIHPFYTTTCPRGHKGLWLDIATGQEAQADPIDLPPAERGRCRWEGPEVIYTFWAKHGPCQSQGCGHRTPIFKSPVIAEKELSISYLELNCPRCGLEFHADLGETRMAPGAERAILEGEPRFGELSQPVAKLFKEYDQGNAQATLNRAAALLDSLPGEPGLRCPDCGAFAGEKPLAIARRHSSSNLRAAERKKKDFGLRTKKVRMRLLIHPDWLKGASGFEGDREPGGWAGAPAELTDQWQEMRGRNLKLVETRGAELPGQLILAGGACLPTGKATVPRQAHFTCAACGREGNTLESVRPTGHTAPAAVYALQCHCPQCEKEKYAYNGRYFKTPDAHDLHRLKRAELEWRERGQTDLRDYWPKQPCWDANMMRANGGVNEGWGYTHWWKMFNSRQLLAHTQLLKALMGSPGDKWPLDVREQALGAFQQYLRNQNMFVFWNIQGDKIEPMFSNPNYHPKNTVIENNVFNLLGRGNWQSNVLKTLEGLKWSKNPCDKVKKTGDAAKSENLSIGDPIIPGVVPYCGSSTDLSLLDNNQFDLIITDPPFGGILFYADLADFFYVWLRLPLLNWYAGRPEAAYFQPERGPHSLEAIDNPAEHPDDRADYEKAPRIKAEHLDVIRQAAGDADLEANDSNPLYRPKPSSDFYCRTLAACWAEAGRRLKDGGILAFTFHHNEDAAWLDVLRALFDAGYLLVATYPVWSDETKGEDAAFGSKKIEYDIIHICRKRLEEPKPAAWSQMRRFVKEEAARLKTLLEHSHGRELPESDLLVILRGKALEFYSRHYGQVLTGEGQVLEVREALLGINQILDDLVEGSGPAAAKRPPERAEPVSRLFLSLFRDKAEIGKDDLHKRLRGTGHAPDDLEARGWIKTVGGTVHAVPAQERFAYFTYPGRNRKIIKTDLDQAYFCLGAALSGLNLENELRNPNFQIKKAVEEILLWLAETRTDPDLRQAAQTAAQIIAHWRTREARRKEAEKPRSLFDQLEATA